jgi:hypothetical protein
MAEKERNLILVNGSHDQRKLSRKAARECKDGSWKLQEMELWTLF